MLRRVDPSNLIDRLVMKDRLRSGWEPVPGKYWSACGVEVRTWFRVLCPPARAETRWEGFLRSLEMCDPEWLSEMTEVAPGLQFHVRLVQAYTADDVERWRRVRDEWAAHPEWLRF